MFKVKLSPLEVKAAQRSLTTLADLMQEQEAPSNTLTQHLQEPNITLTVQNRSNLQIYEDDFYLAPEYISKAQSWLAANKFKTEERIAEVVLTINDCFTYHICKSTRHSDSEIIRDELAQLRAEKIHLALEQNLFEFFYFRYWLGAVHGSGRRLGGASDSRRPIEQHFINSVVESSENLFNVSQGAALCEGENHDSLIGFR